MPCKSLAQKILEELETIKHNKKNYTANEYAMELQRLKIKLARSIDLNTASKSELLILEKILARV